VRKPFRFSANELINYVINANEIINCFNLSNGRLGEGLDIIFANHSVLLGVCCTSRLRSKILFRLDHDQLYLCTNRVARFSNQKSNFGQILEGLANEDVGIFHMIFGLFYGHFVYFNTVG
jgi:hypothetical protein